MQPQRLCTVVRAALAAVCLALAALSSAREARGEEEFLRFLEGLREKGLYDAAIDYIDLMRASPLVPDAVKQEMPFEEGRTLVELARSERDVPTKFKQLDKARDRFEEFIKANPSHSSAPVAETELGTVLMLRGDSYLEQSKKPGNASKKDELIKQAREMMAEARKVFEDADAKFSERLKGFPKFIPEKKVKEREAREQARADVLRAHIYAAAVVYALAKTYPPGSDDAKHLLAEAADKYGKIYDKHRQRLAGQIARARQGQCYQDLGDTKRALGMYEAILAMPDDPEELRKLKANALLLSLQCWLHDNEKKYDIAVEKGSEWVEKARPAEERSPDGLGIRFLTALAEQRLAESLNPEEAAKKKAALAAARKLALFVSKLPGDYRDDAKRLYQSISPSDGAPEAEPTTFAEALDRGKDLLSQWQDKLAQVKSAEAINDEANKPKYEKEAQELRAKSLHDFKLALELRDEETPIDDVNLARYYLCFLSFMAGDYYDAAVLGEYLAFNYPESSGGRQSAKLAMAGYLQVYNNSPVADRDFDMRQMLKMADYITSRWSGEAEADEAWSLLMQLAINEHETQKALGYLAKIGEESPSRPDAELKVGQHLWARFRTASSVKDPAERLPPPELAELTKQARQLLDNGVRRMRVGVDSGASDVSPTLADSVLSLGEIYLDSGDAARALELLNDPKIGPLTLMAAKHPVAQQGNFAVETYKLALRAYVATEALDKAEQIMKELEALVGAKGDANTASMLTNIYVRLGRELEGQVQRLRQENKAEELDKVTKGFQLFLDRISSREQGNTFNSLNWVAETFFSLGSGYDAGGKQLSAEAKAFYEKALRTDEQILALAAKNKDFASADAVKLRMGRTLRRLKDFKKARGLIGEVLAAKPQLIDAQIEGARIYQDWGAEKPTYYKYAILGGQKVKDKDGREANRIWGWAKMAVRVQKDQRFSTQFHEARYNLAKCRMEIAKTKSGTEKSEMLEKAKKDILLTQQLRPDLGGPDSFKRYDSLFGVIQQLLGQPRTGLPREDQKPAAPNEAQGKPATIGNAKSTAKPTVGESTSAPAAAKPTVH